MKTNWLFYLIILSLLFGCAPKENEFFGEVFFVTKKGQKIQLSLVEISIIDYDKMNIFAQDRMQSAKQEIERLKPIIFRTQQEYKKMRQSKEKFYRVYLDNIYSHRYSKKYQDLLASISKKRSELNRLLTSYNSYSKGTYFFAGLPKPTLSTKTDAGGKFILKLKPGKYAIVANTSQKDGKSDKDYYWFISFDTEKGSQQKIILSNDNLFGSECESCIFNLSKLPY
ncbi:MAG: hypothetical protein ABIK92_18700 [Pseudomonadota bacterium]